MSLICTKQLVLCATYFLQEQGTVPKSCWRSLFIFLPRWYLLRPSPYEACNWFLAQKIIRHQKKSIKPKFAWNNGDLSKEEFKMRYYDEFVSGQCGTGIHPLEVSLKIGQPQREGTLTKDRWQGRCQTAHKSQLARDWQVNFLNSCSEFFPLRFSEMTTNDWVVLSQECLQRKIRFTFWFYPLKYVWD